MQTERKFQTKANRVRIKKVRNISDDGRSRAFHILVLLMAFIFGQHGGIMAMNREFADKYEILRILCERERPEEYHEYLKIVPINPFYKNDWGLPRREYLNLINEIGSSGNYDDIFDALYFIAYYKGGAYDEE
jgi:hypothetical protein